MRPPPRRPVGTEDDPDDDEGEEEEEDSWRRPANSYGVAAMRGTRGVLGGDQSLNPGSDDGSDLDDTLGGEGQSRPLVFREILSFVPSCVREHYTVQALQVGVWSRRHLLG